MLRIGYLSKIKNEVIDRDKGKDPEGDSVERCLFGSLLNPFWFQLNKRQLVFQKDTFGITAVLGMPGTVCFEGFFWET